MLARPDFHQHLSRRQRNRNDNERYHKPHCRQHGIQDLPDITRKTRRPQRLQIDIITYRTECVVFTLIQRHQAHVVSEDTAKRYDKELYERAVDGRKRNIDKFLNIIRAVQMRGFYDRYVDVAHRTRKE